MSGIYALIINTDKDEMFYIGSTTRDFKIRFREHKNHLNANNHHNKYLQNLFNKFRNIKFSILEDTAFDSHTDIHRIENEWISKYQQEKIINFGPAYPSPTFGKHWKMGPEGRLKISAANRRRKRTINENEKKERIIREELNKEIIYYIKSLERGISFNWFNNGTDVKHLFPYFDNTFIEEPFYSNTNVNGYYTGLEIQDIFQVSPWKFWRLIDFYERHYLLHHNFTYIDDMKKLNISLQNFKIIRAYDVFESEQEYIRPYKDISRY